MAPVIPIGADHAGVAEHNDAHILLLPARFPSERDAVKMLHRWRTTPLEGGRHLRPLEKIEKATST